MAEETKNKYEDVEKELQTRFSLLPPDLQQIITSSEYQMKLYEVAKKHKLTYEQLGAIEMETTMVLLGMIPPSDFGPGLNDQLNKNDADMKPIIADIVEAVFKPINASLMKLYSPDEATEEENEETGNIPQKMETSIRKDETAILEKAGIGIMPDRATAGMNAPSNTMSRNTLASSVENPPKTQPIRLNDIPKPTEREMLRQQAPAMPAPVRSVTPPTAPVTPPVTPAPTMAMPPRPPAPPMAPKVPTPVVPTATATMNQVVGTGNPVPMNPMAQQLGGQSVSMGTKTLYAPMPSAKIPEPPKTVGAAPVPTGGDAYREPIQ